MVCTSLSNLLRPLFYFLCSILLIHRVLWGLRDIRLILPRIKIFRCVLCNLQFIPFAIELENTRGVELSSEFSLNSNSDLA